MEQVVDAARAARIERTRAAIETARAGWGDDGEVRLDTGVAFGDGEPIHVLVRKRGRRYDLSDEGAAVRKAGASAGRWLETAERVADAHALNVNRRGVVFVPAVEGRDLATLAIQVAETSLALYGELLEL